MTHFEIILSGLSFAFMWVNIIAPKFELAIYGVDVFARKPFNCVMCMSGWATFIISLLNGYTYQSIVFLVVGVFIGAIWEAVSMRWL